MYLNDWAQKGQEQMLQDFGIKEDALVGAEVLLASYTYEDYSGSAFVLFRRDGKLYEVNGSHCSCFGLESDGAWTDEKTQWQPEETCKAALMKRVDADSYMFQGCIPELKQVLETIEGE
jgi:hypothetical protein